MLIAFLSFLTFNTEQLIDELHIFWILNHIILNLFGLFYKKINWKIKRIPLVYSSIASY